MRFIFFIYKEDNNLVFEIHCSICPIIFPIRTKEIQLFPATLKLNFLYVLFPINLFYLLNINAIPNKSRNSKNIKSGSIIRLRT